MTDEEILEMWEAAKTRVAVSCDEAHVHSASQGCLSPKRGNGVPPGDARDINICIFAETLLAERKLIRDVAEKFGMVFMKIGNT
jgi:hypothetical protein